jgi:sulfur carrier protein
MPAGSIAVFFNGQREPLSQRVSLRDFLKNKGYENSFYAVAINCEFVPRSEYVMREIKDGDKIEIVAPMQGG